MTLSSIEFKGSHITICYLFCLQQRLKLKLCERCVLKLRPGGIHIADFLSVSHLMNIHLVEA